MNTHFLGACLIEQGIITPAQLGEALAFQAGTNRRLGDLAVDAGLLTLEQADAVHNQQRETDLNFGELAVALGFVSQHDMNALRFRQQVQQVHLGEALLTLGYLTHGQFAQSLDLYAVQEKARRDGLTLLFSNHCRSSSLQGLVSMLERAFLRFARCPLKAQGGLQEADLQKLPYQFTSEIPAGGGKTLRFTLHLGSEMLGVISRTLFGRELNEAQTHDAAREILGIMCRYLRQSIILPDAAPIPCLFSTPGTAPKEPCLRIKLACPEAGVGLTIHLAPDQV